MPSSVTPLYQTTTYSLGLESSQLEDINQQLFTMSAKERVRWGLTHLPGEFVLSSSFGIQAAVMLHLITREYPDIPVVLTDTGYLFPETYQFIDELTARLNLNLHVYRAKESAAWQEARYGSRWEQGVEGITAYNQQNKLEPMQRALSELGIQTWFAGLRRQQADSRGDLPVLQQLKNQFKLFPIIDWSNKDVHYYLKEYDLPYHPLWEKGYVSVGDWHTSQPLQAGMSEQDTRFFGLKRECGLHEFGDGI
jgi:phosphoadenosine phosphosulfate reductase